MPESPVEKRKRVLEGIEKTDRSGSEEHQWQAKGLTRQQERALNDLEEAVSELQGWRGIEIADEEDRHHQQSDQFIYERAITRAVRARLWQHPVVREWLAARRSLGDWEGLRHFRLGLESGVTKTMSKADFWIAFEARDLIDQGDGPEAMREALIKKLKDPKSKGRKKWEEYFDLAPTDIERLIDRLEGSRQNFHQWLKRLRLI